MKHAGAATLKELEVLLCELRQLAGLVERKPGIFYRRSQAFVHFHEDVSGLFVDVKLNGTEFDRLRVSSPEERRRFIGAVRCALGLEA